MGNWKSSEFGISTLLVGSIPASIFNISSLKFIWLQKNSLSGNVETNISLFSCKLPCMSALSNLEGLHLWDNNLSGSSPDSISNASKLRQLELAQNFFSGLIPNALGNLKSLERLSLWSNYVTTKTSILMPESFTTTFNPLNCLLPTSLSNLSKSLQVFDVSTSKIRGSIRIEIGSLNNVIALDFYGNELSGSIPRKIRRLKNIQYVDFGGNKLQGPIPHELCGLKRLKQRAYLRGRSFAPSIAIGGGRGIGVSKRGWLSGAQREVCLGFVDLSKWLSALFFFNFMHIVKRHRLKLFQWLQNGLGDLIFLRMVDLSSNKFHSSIPLSFWSLKDILEVNLSSNHFNGSLPFEIKKLKVITNLDLSRNFFSSDIPPTFESLQDLQVLLLSHNRLCPIPESLGDMLSLKVLDISKNNISGVIPKSLEILSYLKIFDVFFNKLEGEIPNSGCFVNFTAKSFMNNYALCGSPRLQVQPCKNKIPRQNNKALMHALKYIFPVFGSIIIVVALIIVYKKWKNKSTDWRRISYYQLSKATSGFDDNNLLGSGSFGSVYKGILAEGTEFAVKVFNLDLDEAFRSFDVECEVMGKILHRNLVKVITCCSTIDFKVLGTKLQQNKQTKELELQKSYLFLLLSEDQKNSMILPIFATQFRHLNKQTLEEISFVHCALKPSKVLLDNDMVAHVGDFGIAKLLGEGDSMKQTMTLATIGYMAPGIISVKSDVYSYGILLMETFTRRKPTDEYFSGEMDMKRWVKTNSVVDPNIVQEKDEYIVIKTIMDLA
ncbi:hypothetical protein V6Z11_D05G313100 [Gossypium hirsutum]